MISGQFLERSVPRNGQFLEKVTGQWSVTTFLDLPHDIPGNMTSNQSYMTTTTHTASELLTHGDIAVCLA